MDDKYLWVHEPPSGSSAEEWAVAYEKLADHAAGLLDEDLYVPERNKLIYFVLNDAAQRCKQEAERLAPGILKRRLQAQLKNYQARLEELTD